MSDNIHKKIQSTLATVGKACFVKYYSFFIDDTYSNNELSQLLQTNEGYSPKSSLVRVTSSRKLIKENLSKDALKLIINSNIKGDIRLLAKTLLENNQGTIKGWTEEELRETVLIYIEMYNHQKNNKSFNKREYYRQLHIKFGRTEKAYEYRMQNISWIFALSGKNWVKGLKPAQNIGRNIGEKIELIIAQHENRPPNPNIIFELNVHSYKNSKNTQKPEGIAAPKSALSSTTVYERSAEVKAWVLNRANGICELCKQNSPFTSLTGQPYLEVHHVKRLSLGGSDQVSNCVGLCPNCHRRLHYSIDADLLVKKLYETITDLKPE